MSERDMTLLYMAARVDPNLRAAAMRVDEELRALRESHAELLAVLKTWAGLFGEACGECDPCGWGDGDCVHWPLIQSTAAAIQKAEAING